jgi:hypothetical protein
MDTVDPERKSVASVFRVSQNEELIFFGKQEMSLFGLNIFKTAFTSVVFGDLMKIGVYIT